MRFITLLIFLCFFSQASSEEFDPPEGYELANIEEEGVELDDDQLAKAVFKPTKDAPDSNLALATLESGPSAVVANCVNAISGDFFDSQVSLVVPGPQPLVVQSSYCSSEKEWHFQHMPILEAGLSEGRNHLYVRYVDDNGSGMTYRAYTDESRPDGIKGHQLSIPSALFKKGLTNCGSGEISGQTNWKNSHVSYLRKKSEKFYLLRHGSHIDRVFSRFKRQRGHTSIGAPTGKFHLHSENHPNGNRLLYQYYGKERLSCVKAVNKVEKCLAEIRITQPQFNKRISTSSHPKKNIQNLTRWSSGTHSVLFDFEDEEKKRIKKIQSSQAIPVHYIYDFKTNLLRKKILPEGRFLEIVYYDSGKAKGKVKSLRTPIGITHTFSYHFEDFAHVTFVKDAEENCTQYSYDKETKRLKSIIRKDNKGEVINIETFSWSPNPRHSGNLASRSLADAKQIYFYRTLDYDAFGNVTYDKLFGNLTGKFQDYNDKNAASITPEVFIKTYNHSQDAWNLVLEENDGKKYISYSYYPGTNLLKQRFTKSKDQLLKREFFEYDENGVVIKEIWDDGQATEEGDLSCVTERHIKLTVPRTETPIGLPQIIEERYLDQKSNQYLLLKKTVNSHSEEGKLLQEDHYDSDGNFAYSLKWEYDYLGNVTKKTDALGQQTTFQYDANGNKIREEGPLPGWHKELVYDDSNSLIAEKEVWPNGSTFVTTHRYNLLNQRVATIDSFGNETTFQYDALGRLLRTQGPPVYLSPDNLSIPFEETHYDGMGNAIVKKDANGNVTQFFCTTRGKPYRIEHPDGSVEQKEYSLEGLLIQEIAKNGVITKYVHDAFDHVIQTVTCDSEGNPLKESLATYSAFQLLSETNEAGMLTTYEYDGAGRCLSKTQGDHLTRYEYDALGRTIKTLDFIGNSDARVTHKHYDLLDRVIEERIEDLQGQVFSQKQFSYDANGNRTSTTILSQAGHAKKETEYNPAGKPLSIQDALGNKTLFFYDYEFIYQDQKVLKITKVDPLGNQDVQIHDTHGNIRCQMRLDAFGCIIQKECCFYDALGNKTLSQISIYQGKDYQRTNETVWEYDAMGNMTLCMEAKGTPKQKITRHHYNKSGQKESTQMPNGISILNEYDNLGRLSAYQSTDNTISYQYHYDIQDHPILVEDLIHGTSTKRSYDEYGRLISETLDHGLTLAYTYDQLDRPLTVVLPDNTSIRYHHNAHHLLAVERIKDKKVTYTHQYKSYDQAGNVIEETLLGKAGSIHYQYDLLGRSISMKTPGWKETIPAGGFDAAGNLLKREVTDPQGSLAYTYAYDNLYQLISENGSVSHTYQNDSLYNRTAKDEDPYTVNSLNELLSQADCSYLYDDNGNLTEKGSGDEKTRYVYDALDRLVEVSDVSKTTTYTYDSFHRRIGKKCNGIETLYFYQGQNEIGASCKGKITQLRVLGIAYGAEIGGSVAFELDGKIYAPIHDPLGNVVALLDSAGNVAESYRYTAFGEMEVFSKIAINNPWRFSSKRFDEETGFIYFGRRYYAPDIGRWITPDPAGYADGPNLYAYVHNHPLAYIDPDGQLAWLLAPLAFMALDYALPVAAAFIEPYAGAMAASFIMGVSKGNNLSFFEPSAVADPSSLLCEKAGMALGVALNFSPTKAVEKAGAKIGTSVKNLATSFLRKEAIEVATNAVASKATKVFHWFKSPAPLKQSARKTAQAVEEFYDGNAFKFAKDELTRLGLKNGTKCSASEALELGQQYLGKGYKEAIAKSGRFVSADSRRAFRMGVDDILGNHMGGPHVNFEVLVPNSKIKKLGMKRTNIHVFFTD